jgi:hypothetical protein
MQLMLDVFERSPSSIRSTVHRPTVDLMLLYGRALYRVVTTWHYQALTLREQGTQFTKAHSCTIQGYLDSLLAQQNTVILINRSW